VGDAPLTHLGRIDSQVKMLDHGVEGRQPQELERLGNTEYY